MNKSFVKIIGNDNNIIGYISTDFLGNKTVYDPNFKIRGFYHKDDNLTIDAYDNIVGVGDGAYYLLKFI